MIQAQGLTKVYGNRRVVEDVSFSVGRGEILGFLGPNGAGKTTTMRILAGYTPATAGRASIAGHDVRRDSFRARAHLGYLPENAPLYPSMIVRDYLRFISEVKGHPRAARESFVNQVIEECGLTEVTRRLIGNLSKGFRQRVGLAQAIVGNPPVLILDEPTVGLDPIQIAEVRGMIKNMAGRRTVLLSTHILPEVNMTCQKVIVIHQGRIAAEGTPDKLVSSLTSENAILVTLEADPARARERLEKIEGVQRVEVERQIGPRHTVFRIYSSPGCDPRKEIVRVVVIAGWTLVELGTVQPSLEDVFLRVISSPEQTTSDAPSEVPEDSDNDADRTPEREVDS